MRRGVIVWALLVVVASATPRAASAQPQEPSRTSFPGSVLINSGLASPLEDENVLTNYSLEQGFTILQRGPNRVIPFLTVSGSRDRAGLDWNNEVLWQAGMKFARGFRSGVVQFGAAYAHENRLSSGISEGRPSWFGNYWFGWSGTLASRRSRALVPGFPGSSWSFVGTPGPTERANFIGMWFVEQGIAVARVASVTIVPFAENMLTIDSAGRPWNNRYHAGGGLKFRIPVGRGTIEAAGTYKHERRWKEARTAGGITASVNLWYGWDPALRH
jgi:hypothetical protein